MSQFETNWTKEELKAYILMYCASADFNESSDEVDFIKSRIDSGRYDELHQDIEASNDYQSIQKILVSMNKHGYSANEKDVLFNEIKALFLADGNYDVLERNLFQALGRILK